MANGIALSAKLNKKEFYTYCVLGDGELEEAMVWEATMTSSKYKLDNVITFVDYNHLQIDGTIEEVIGNTKIKEKFEAFSWNVLTVNGHSIPDILNAIDKAKKTKGIPSVIIMNTIKGKGVSFMENQVNWHGKAPSAEEMEQALKELEV